MIESRRPVRADGFSKMGWGGLQHPIVKIITSKCHICHELRFRPSLPNCQIEACHGISLPHLTLQGTLCKLVIVCLLGVVVLCPLLRFSVCVTSHMKYLFVALWPVPHVPKHSIAIKSCGGHSS